MLETIGINCGDLFGLDAVFDDAKERRFLALTKPTAPSPAHDLEPDALLLAEGPNGQTGRCWIVGVLQEAKYARRDPEHGFACGHVERFEVPILVPDDLHHPERVRLIGSKFKAFAPSEFVYLPAGVIEQARATRDRLKRWYEGP